MVNSFVFNNHETAYATQGLKNTINCMFETCNSCKVRAHVKALNKDGRTSKRKGVTLDTWDFHGAMREVIIYAPNGKLNQTGMALYDLASEIEFDYPVRVSVAKREPLPYGAMEY